MAKFEEYLDPVDGTRWRIDVEFVDSNWTCIWGNGCEGILEHRAAELNQGCCSVGAHLIDEDEAMLISALGLTLEPERFQNYEAAATGGVLADGEQPATRVVNDACIFHNQPGFAGGVGCALHIGAVDAGESPLDWKPSICWQAPIKVDHHDDGSKTLRPWAKSDWGEGEHLAWCCSERNEGPDDGPTAYVGEVPVSESLHEELTGLLGPEIAVQLRNRSK